MATKDPEDRKAGSIKGQIAGLEKDFKSKKLIWLIPAVFLIALSVFLLKPKPQSQLIISGSENKFKANFQLSKSARSLAESFLQSANIQQNILNGFEFTLDGTSSAKLGYISPIYTRLTVQKDSINFNGTTQVALTSDTYEIQENFKLPQSSNIVIFGQDLVPFIKKKVTLGQDFETWTSENLK
ncbi:MAG: hypothetical protein Q8P25_04760, partial [Candidatus Curtissbacteria bacterium]|nr:hypothetical protein [Candidatus Curtissbacteria bacterium]